MRWQPEKANNSLVAPSKQALPQTGDSKDEMTAAVGLALAGLGMEVGYAGARRKRKKQTVRADAE